MPQLPMDIQTPLLTVDIIIRYQDGIVLIERKNPPPGWALPGGFVDIGESSRRCCNQGGKGGDVARCNTRGAISRRIQSRTRPPIHTATMVFIADGKGMLKGQDDARNAAVFTSETLPPQIAFDHGRIIADYFTYRKIAKKPDLK